MSPPRGSFKSFLQQESTSLFLHFLKCQHFTFLLLEVQNPSFIRSLALAVICDPREALLQSCTMPVTGTVASYRVQCPPPVILTHYTRCRK